MASLRLVPFATASISSRPSRARSRHQRTTTHGDSRSSSQRHALHTTTSVPGMHRGDTALGGAGPRLPRRFFSQPPAAAPENKEAGGKLELTPAKIAELIEVSFLQSCLQLSQGYVDVLKLFIVAVKAGYEYPLGLEELNALVETCPVNSAGRDLTDEEQALRLEWMSMVYEMVTALKDSQILDRGDSDDDGSSGDDGAATLRISKVRQAMLAIQKELQREETTTGGKRDATVALNNLTVEQALARSPSLSQWNAAMLDPMEKAFLTNDIRVALMTFRVLEEEKVCTMDASGSRVTSKGSAELGDEVPRPPIPGT